MSEVVENNEDSFKINDKMYSSKDSSFVENENWTCEKDWAVVRFYIAIVFLRTKVLTAPAPLPLKINMSFSAFILRNMMYNDFFKKVYDANLECDNLFELHLEHMLKCNKTCYIEETLSAARLAIGENIMKPCDNYQTMKEKDGEYRTDEKVDLEHLPTIESAKKMTYTWFNKVKENLFFELKVSDIACFETQGNVSEQWGLFEDSFRSIDSYEQTFLNFHEYQNILSEEEKNAVEIQYDFLKNNRFYLCKSDMNRNTDDDLHVLAYWQLKFNPNWSYKDILKESSSLKEPFHRGAEYCWRIIYIYRLQIACIFEQSILLSEEYPDMEKVQFWNSVDQFLPYKTKQNMHFLNDDTDWLKIFEDKDFRKKCIENPKILECLAFFARFNKEKFSDLKSKSIEKILFETRNGFDVRVLETIKFSNIDKLQFLYTKEKTENQKQVCEIFKSEEFEQFCTNNFDKVSLLIELMCDYPEIFADNSFDFEKKYMIAEALRSMKEVQIIKKNELELLKPYLQYSTTPEKAKAYYLLMRDYPDIFADASLNLKEKYMIAEALRSMKEVQIIEKNELESLKPYWKDSKTPEKAKAYYLLMRDYPDIFADNSFDFEKKYMIYETFIPQELDVYNIYARTLSPFLNICQTPQELRVAYFIWENTNWLNQFWLMKKLTRENLTSIVKILGKNINKADVLQQKTSFLFNLWPAFAQI